MKDVDEYVKIISSSKTKREYVSNIISANKQIRLEIGEIVQSEEIKERSSLKKIVDKQDQKWKSICSKIREPQLNNAFMENLENSCPIILR